MSEEKGGGLPLFFEGTTDFGKNGRGVQHILSKKGLDRNSVNKWDVFMML